MTQYIATDNGGRDRWLAIYGIGDTEDAARRDAYTTHPTDYPTDREGQSVFDVLPATDRLIERVREIGGAPQDVRWQVVDGVADVRGVEVE